MRRLQSLLIAALALPALIVLVAGPALADGLMSMSDPAVGTAGPQSIEGPLTLTCTACEDALTLPSGLRIGGAVSNPGATHGGSVAINDPVRWLSTTTALLESSTAATEGSDTAFVLNSIVDLAGNDKLLSLQRAGAEKMMVTGDGHIYANGLFINQIAARASTVPLIARGTMSDAADAVGVRVGNTNTLTAPGSKVVAFCADNPSTCASEVASIAHDGAATFAGRVSGAGVQAVAGTEPTCDESARGLIWTVAGGAGVADTVRVCAKDAADAFAWRTIY